MHPSSFRGNGRDIKSASLFTLRAGRFSADFGFAGPRLNFWAGSAHTGEHARSELSTGSRCSRIIATFYAGHSFIEVSVVRDEFLMIEVLWVAPGTTRRKGIGRQLLDQVITEARARKLREVRVQPTAFEYDRHGKISSFGDSPIHERLMAWYTKKLGFVAESV